jgi:tRNA pseudouridine38-40 synthase
MRVKAIVSYDGGYFKGFQRQKSTKDTVTTHIEESLKALNIKSEIRGSGRTDAKVHASGQVIDFEIPHYWSDTQKLQRELNRKLKKIYIKHISIVDDSFHSRFYAKRRVYRYIFKTTKPSIFEENYISYYPPFDKYALSNALKLFEGVHNFEYFQKSGSVVDTTTKEIYSTRYIQREDYHYIYFEANGFLRSQVRMMVDALMLSVNKTITISQLQEQIDHRVKHTQTLAPPEGLYLARVIY